MKILVGLGNPTAKYAHTRHNVGWLLLDEIQKQFGLEEWRQQSQFRAQIAAAHIGAHKVFLVKPQTFMNLSGESISLIRKFYRLDPSDVIALYDDVALLWGQLRFRAQGSAGGHNGVKSLIQHLGTQQFPRYKVGIKDPALMAHRDLAAYVLGKLTPAEEQHLTQLAPQVLQKIKQDLL